MNMPKEMTVQELVKTKDSIINHIKKAKKGEESSLMYVRNPIIQSRDLSDKPRFIIIGGSTLQYGDVVTGNRYSNMVEEKLGVIDNKETFLNIIERVAGDAEIIAINFSFPCEAFLRNGMMEMKLIKPTKEHKFEGLIGENLGETIQEYFKTKGREVECHLAHDLTALLANVFDKKNTQIGGVIGTGFNFGFIEGNDIINLETGGFSAFELSESGKYVDEHSEFPGTGVFEKEISGGYLHLQYNYYAKALALPEVKDTKEVHLKIFKGDEQESIIAQRIFDRSSGFASATIAAIIDYQQEVGLHNSGPVELIIEGSVYKRNEYYRQAVDNYLEIMGVTTPIKFVSMHNSQITGIISAVFVA